MLKTRVIPVLLLRHWGLEKSIRYDDYIYVGSPINAARVFTGRNVDELIVLDIAATSERRGPRAEIIEQIAEETTMPLTVGGGIRSLDMVGDLMRAGADRIVLNTTAVQSPELVTQAAERYGRQCVVVSIDVRRGPAGTCEVYTHGGKQPTRLDPVAWATQVESLGAGEILLTSIDRDGTMEGYDLPLVRNVSDAVGIPVIACGGAGRVDHLAAAIEQGHASAVASGAFFLFYGRRRTVLITHPTDEELLQHLGTECIRTKDIWHGLHGST